MRPLTDGDLRKANHVALTTAIADFYHAHNTADNIVESHRWLNVLECARAVGAAYKCPNRKDIGEDLLNVNAKNYMMHNIAEAKVDADTFGLSMLGDRATIKKWHCSMSWCLTVIFIRWSPQLVLDVARGA